MEVPAPNWNWDQIASVIFDVDGTLYAQQRLRIYMARDLLTQCLTTGGGNTIAILRTYRRLREHAADAELRDFTEYLIDATALECHVKCQEVRQVIGEWINARPLLYLSKCRYRGIVDLFAALRGSGKTVSVWSDYPAEEKLVALGLSADYIVSSEDPDVRFLKPHPRGLEVLLQRTGIPASSSLVIGDRIERDGHGARRAGAHALIRSSRQIAGWLTYADYREDVFRPMLANRI
jgi:FMN phosphatase YigB (HAD superfamily)